MTPVYVGGYVDVVSLPKIEKELYLEPSIVATLLPYTDPLPINIEHVPEAHVGHTIGLFQVTHGIFCLGKLTSHDFLALASRLAGDSRAAQIQLNPMPRDPLLEMLHTWLPELSLSSLHPEELQDPNHPPAFQHVSLCALGRRRGSIAVYGPDPTWVVSKFDSLTREEAGKITVNCLDLCERQVTPPEFAAPLETLMAKAIDAGFIRDRTDLLKTDKGVARVARSTYLKASQFPCAQHCGNRDTRTMSALPEDNITIPKSTFLTMVQSSLDNMRNQGHRTYVSAPPSMPATAAYPSWIPPPELTVPSYAPPVAPPFPFQSAFAPQPSPYAATYYSPTYGYAPAPSRHQKRKRDVELSDEPVFPGEEVGIHKDVMALSKNILDIQADLRDLKRAASQTSGAQDADQRPQPPPVQFSWPQTYASAPYLAYQPQWYSGTDTHLHAPQPYQSAQGIQQTQPPPPQPASHHAGLATQPATPAPAAQESVMSNAIPSASAPRAGACPPLDPECGQSARAPVEASAQPAPVSQIQKMFCEELLK
ncbi:capsid protein [Macaca mulatta rhadinovirus 17577]|uniref:Capsid scaffolding protein n=1 Tax=Macaca mulatta rhadinovirus 17577 TaxID=83534 RepID=Q9WRT5_9GAMA|nr:capsid protein [Macacine gammaherpesvirus 5]AAD21343.1 capsid protein [Macaca mulatta rhadinovirus 17577]WUF06310.1 capsid protein [synthetic construct]WVG99617.1 capsid protein [Macaca mulatta rhadinovirus]WSP06987.1 capsid protein [Macacine gammaherpesvirus 5]WUF06389.1 capsid protein [synthetic construct]